MRRGLSNHIRVLCNASVSRLGLHGMRRGLANHNRSMQSIPTLRRVLLVDAACDEVWPITIVHMWQRNASVPRLGLNDMRRGLTSHNRLYKYQVQISVSTPPAIPLPSLSFLLEGNTGVDPANHRWRRGRVRARGRWSDNRHGWAAIVGLSLERRGKYWSCDFGTS